MDPLSITASIIAILQVTATLVNYANDVKDAPKDRARFAMEASSLSSLLLNLRYQIEDEGCEKSNEAWTREVTLLGVSGGPLDQYKHALEKLQLKTVSGKGLVKIGDALWWRFTKEEVAGILLRIERLKSLIQIALQMDHIKLSQAIKTRLDDIYDNSDELRLGMDVVRSQIPAIQDSVDAVQRDQDRKKNQELVEWISSAQFSSQQSDFIARRQLGTGQWFLDSPEFNNWLDGPSHTLFCPGIPGAGKTMMSAIAIDHLHKMAYTDLCGVAQVFCNYKSQSEQSTTSLLSAILKQLVQANPSAAEAASSLYQRHSPQGTRPSLDDIFDALKAAMKTFVKVYVVIDALDECSDRDGTRGQLLAKLRDLQHEFDLRLMVTSRSIADVVSQFKSSPMLEVRASAADVRRFVSGQIHRLPRCVQRDVTLQAEVEDKIGEAVDGMFLLARLHVDSLLDKRTKAKIQNMLEVLPRGLHALKAAYDDAIKRIEAQLADDSKLARSVLSWITYAERPLTTGELCHALAVGPDDTDLNEDNILDVEDIVSVCAGLVTVDEESNIVRLVHYTTQEYFLNIREAWNPTAQQEITTTCLTYLSFDSFRSGSCDEHATFEERIACYAFIDYASRYLGHHAQTVQEQVSQLAFAFLWDNKLVSCALQIVSMRGYSLTHYGQRFQKNATGVHLTAKLGLQYFLTGLLSGSGGASSMAADSIDFEGRTPLSLAAEEGNVSIVKLLVERDDVEVDLKDDKGRTPLMWAAQEGHEAVVKVLVELDRVDVAAKDKFGEASLSFAARGGHATTVELLLEQKGIDANTTCLRNETPVLLAVFEEDVEIVKLLLGRKDIKADVKSIHSLTPLLVAAKEGNEAIVKLLLKRKGVNVNTKNEYGRTPLSLAAKKGHEAIVKLLLECEDVKTNLEDEYGLRPLSLAAEKGHGAIVKLLLDRKDEAGKTLISWVAGGEKHSLVQERNKLAVELFLGRHDVDVNSMDEYGQSLLSQAVQQGDELFVELLLTQPNVDVNSKDKTGQAPLLWAAQEGHQAIAELLLQQADIQVNVTDKVNLTPLSWAARRGHRAVVKLLLEREDIEVNSKDNDDQTALTWAATRGHGAVVELLLEREDIEATTVMYMFGQTPLLCAAKYGHEAIVRRLLERKDVVEAEAEKKEGSSVLTWAARNGQEALVKMLLERDDIDADRKDDYGRTPLWYAANIGQEEIVKLLLERETDVEAKGGFDRTLLFYAAKEGREGIVKLLLERDADPVAKDINGETPLSVAEENGHKGIVELLRLKLEHP